MKTPIESILSIFENRAELTELGTLARKFSDTVDNFDAPGQDDPDDLGRQVLDTMRELSVKIPDSGEIESEELDLSEWNEQNGW